MGWHCLHVTRVHDPPVSIVLRSYNEGWALKDTLDALRLQDYHSWQLIVFDSGSTDGSVELIRRAQPRRFIQLQPHEYNPARVLNHGVRLAETELVICLNADATPQGPGWLRPLASRLQDRHAAAVFGRQIPRPDCKAVFACDYERCFGPQRESAKWGHFFSMANSGLRKDIWSKRGFLETFQYSEDDEYTRWCKREGYQVVYVPDSVVMHSHNYTPAQAYRRHFGEGRALAAVWPGRQRDFNWLRAVLLGWANDARRDFCFCLRQRRLQEWGHALRIRWAQRRGKFEGFHQGWRLDRSGDRAPSPPGRARLLPDPSPIENYE